MTARGADASHVLIVANPYSGRRENGTLVATFSAALRRVGLEANVLWSPVREAAELRDPELPRRCRCVVIAGGDGTIADLVNCRPAVPVAVLPLGNKNLFAREFGFRCPAERLAQAIAERRVRRIDVGRAGDRLFCLMVSAGFDAAVVHRVAAWRARGTGLRRVTDLSYLLPVLGTLRRYAYPPVELEADGVVVRGTHAFIFNLPRYGVPFHFGPDVRPDDGRLDWVVLERPGLRSLLGGAWRVAVGSRGKGILFGSAREVRLRSEGPLPIQIDGDPAGWTPVDIAILPSSLDVIVP